MERTNLSYLRKWLSSPHRKPLVVRGARQVGKTWLVRELAAKEDRKLVEINFEKNKEIADLFASNNPEYIVKRLEQRLGQSIDPKNTILFLDEIQERPELFSKLRWFAEEMAELPIIAAGSLLEFVLGKEGMSMPVGRVQFFYLEPFSFIEFLKAQGKEQLSELISTYIWGEEIPQVIHEEIMRLFREYILVGGLPQAVSSWSLTHSFEDLFDIHHSLLSSYRDDFGKYRGRIDSEKLERVFDTVPRSLGRKFVYSNVDPLAKISTIKQCLSLLCRARVCHKVQSTAANGLPLGAEIREAFFKVIFLDVGLSTTIVGLRLEEIIDIKEVQLINAGATAEQVVGQLLRTIEPANIEPNLYYWLREGKGASAEVDYLLQHHNKIIPIEVKAGSTGRLMSLHQFMWLKKLSLAVRINSELPLKSPVQIKNSEGNVVSYELRSIPFYLISELHRLVE